MTSRTRARLGGAVDRMFGSRSGRVIASCRLVMAAVFFLALWMDPAQPVRGASLGYDLLRAYMLLAVVLLIVSWYSWWQDHRLAPIVLVVDVAVFLTAVFFTESRTSDFASPFFAFFVYLLLSAALRWGWQATLATGLAVTFLYLDVGVVMAVSDLPFDIYRFGRRVIYMSVLGLVMAWFSLQRREQKVERFIEPFMADVGELPLQAALAYAVGHLHARIGVIAWADFGESHTRIHALGPVSPPTLVTRPAFDAERGFGSAVRLFDRRRRRSLCMRADGSLGSAFPATEEPLAALCGIDEALALPIAAAGGRGEVLLAAIDGVGIDHVRIGVPLAREISASFDRQASLAMASERALARARDSLARDLHDTVVQSLAGAALRIEGLRGWIQRGGDPEPEIEEVKRLLREEQRNVRSIMAQLRQGTASSGALEAAAAVRVLLPALETYWGISIRMVPQSDPFAIPSWMAHELDGILREAVANAVRHGGANDIVVTVAGDSSRLAMTISDNGRGFPKGEDLVRPRSITDRVIGLGGAITLPPVPEGACLEIILPMEIER